MDVEDETNCYLKYLNDTEAPNSYLLENNEVGLFSVEPIFSDWPQEGFPLLLTNPIITKEKCPTEDAVEKHLIQRASSELTDAEFHESFPESLKENVLIEEDNNDKELIDNDLKETDTIPKKFPNKSLDNDSNQLKLDGEKAVKGFPFRDNVLKIKENIEIDNSVQFLDEDYLTDEVKVPLNNQLLPNQNYVLIKSNSKSPKIIQLTDVDGSPIPVDNCVLDSINVHDTAEKPVETENKQKTVNDLFLTVIANKCKICSFLCEDLEQIKKHISIKHPEYIFTHNGLSNETSVSLINNENKTKENAESKKEFVLFVCSECHGVCTNKMDLKLHMMQTHGLATEAEPIENKPEEAKRIPHEPNKKILTPLDDINVGLVKKQEKAMKQVKCSVKGCPAGFPTEALKWKHVNLHIGNTKNVFKCSECDKQFLMWAIARVHMHTEHGIDFGMIVCPMCHNFKNYRAVRVVKHMLIHAEDKPFMCADCGKSFKQLPQLKNHEVTHKLPEDMPTWAKVKKCDKCDRFFSNARCLKRHIKTVHEKIQPFICNICGHKSARKAMLELHLRQHTAEKPYNCDYCSFRTRDHNSLKKHVMKHLGTVAYICPYCPYSCIQATAYKKHLVNKHKNKKDNMVLFCKYCPYSTINEMNLIAHEKNHKSAIRKGADDATICNRSDVNDTELQTDEETQSGFLNTDYHTEETVDNGGITIPAGLELP